MSVTGEALHYLMQAKKHHQIATSLKSLDKKDAKARLRGCTVDMSNYPEEVREYVETQIRERGRYSYNVNPNGFSFHLNSKGLEALARSSLEKVAELVKPKQVSAAFDHVPTVMHKRFFLYKLVDVRGVQWVIQNGVDEIIKTTEEPSDDSYHSNPRRSLFASFKTTKKEQAIQNGEMLKELVKRGFHLDCKLESSMSIALAMKYIVLGIDELVPIIQTLQQDFLKTVVTIKKVQSKFPKRTPQIVIDKMRESLLGNKFIGEDGKKQLMLIL
jgi:hypothetical protein